MPRDKTGTRMLWGSRGLAGAASSCLQEARGVQSFFFFSFLKSFSGISVGVLGVRFILLYDRAVDHFASLEPRGLRSSPHQECSRPQGGNWEFKSYPLKNTLASALRR